MKAQALAKWVLAANALTCARLAAKRASPALAGLLLAERAAWEAYRALPSDLDTYEARA